MIELVVVIVVIGILGAVAMARYFDRKSFDAYAFSGHAKALLGYAQKVAIAQNREVFVRLDGNSVALCFDAACSAANLVSAPGGSNSGATATKSSCLAGGSYAPAWACEGRPANVVFAQSRAYAYFYFDALGAPYAPTDPVGQMASSFALLAITLSGDGSSFTVTVEPETGYVH